MSLLFISSEGGDFMLPECLHNLSFNERLTEDHIYPCKMLSKSVPSVILWPIDNKKLQKFFFEFHYAWKFILFKQGIHSVADPGFPVGGGAWTSDTGTCW